MATKTAAVQEEFQRLMQEMTDRREGKGPKLGFEQAMESFYEKGPDDQRHSSPTKRLISHKNTSF